jgi:hypothetical protein
VARPNLTNPLSSTTGVRNDVFSELEQPNSTDAPASNPLAITDKRHQQGADAAIPPDTADTWASSSELTPTTAQESPSPRNSQPQSAVVTPAASDSSLDRGRILFGDDSSKFTP